MPGSVVVVRHSYAPGSFDPPDARLEDCFTQRNLDADGRAQARRLGEAFPSRGSPWWSQGPVVFPSDPVDSTAWFHNPTREPTRYAVVIASETLSRR